MRQRRASSWKRDCGRHLAPLITAKKADKVAEVAATPEPAPTEAPPAETAEEAKPAKPARKSRAKKAKDEPAAEAAAAEAPGPTADNDEADASGDGPRRGWWQRTFG